MTAPAMVMPFDLWPPHDQEAWLAGTAPSRGLRRQRHADTLTPKSIDLAQRSYGRLLAILAEHDGLDPHLTPAGRVTVDAVALLFDQLRAAGNCDNAIKSRLFHLRTALRIMTPGTDLDWITRPGGVPLDAFLTQEVSDHLSVPSSPVLFRWGLTMMTDQTLPSAPTARLAICREYRNGLVIALLACRAPRLGSLAQMRLGENLAKHNGEYWVRLPSSIVKNRKEVHYSLPAALTPRIDRYLQDIRPILLDPAKTDAVWGSGDGGAHAFRHALASTLAEADPTNPGLAAVVLGITEAVVHAHYRKARQADAALKFQADLKAERARTRGAAAQAFGG